MPSLASAGAEKVSEQAVRVVGVVPSHVLAGKEVIGDDLGVTVATDLRLDYLRTRKHPKIGP
jgi:hypothetical protein